MPVHNTSTANPSRGISPLTANLATRYTADQATITHNLGFIPSTTGFARVTPALQDTEIDVPTVAGIHVALDISAFDKTNSTAGQEIVVLRQGSG